MGMSFGILLKFQLSLNGAFNVLRGNLAFFDYAMSQNSSGSFVKEVENPIIDSAMTDSEFIDIVTQIIGFRASELMTTLLEPLDSCQAFGLGFRFQAQDPVQDRHFRVIFLIESNPDFSHPSSFQYLSKLNKN